MGILIGYGRYPDDWPEISRRKKEEAGYVCERCGRRHNPEGNVMITVHHLDGNKANCDDWNLAVLCRRCHLWATAKINLKQLMFLVPKWLKPHLEGYLKWTESSGCGC